MWYFLAFTVLPAEAAKILDGLQLVAANGTITIPMVAEGITFLCTDDLRAVLEALGLGDREYTLADTNIEGVQCIEIGAVRPQVALAMNEAETPLAPGAEALVEAYFAGLQTVRTGLTNTRDRAQKEIDRLTRELAQAHEQLVLAELQTSVFAGMREEVGKGLGAEYEKITADTRVVRALAAGGCLAIETQPIVIATTPPRNIGSLRIIIGFADGSIAVKSDKPTGPTPHPLVSPNGLLRLGQFRDTIVRYFARREIGTAVKLLLDLLSKPPEDALALQMMVQWPEAPATPTP